MNVNSEKKSAKVKRAKIISNPHLIELQMGIGLVCKLCEELNYRGITYCHWKSNAMLDLSALGHNDLDLLVKRSDMQFFSEILYQLGFKLALVPLGKRMPGVWDYYGYDEEADKLVHVHAHFQLVIGHDSTKNFRIPIEKPYLESAVQGNIFKVPMPEFELIVFVLRMVIKHSTWDVIIQGHGRLSVSERQELAYLKSLVSTDKICNILKQHLPCVDIRLFDSCMQSLLPNCPFWIRVRVGQKLQSALKGNTRRSQISDIWLKLWRRFLSGVQQRAFGCASKNRLAGGGLLVAVVGGDGAGKTTAIDKLFSWLSKDFEIIRLHMGKPAWSKTTTLVRGILKIGNMIGFYPFMRAPIEYRLGNKSVAFPGYPWMIREICTARDRYIAYARARRFATNGGLVICDRFPLSNVKLMDGPQVERMTRSIKTNRLIKLLTNLEKRFYQPINLPDLLVVLKVDPDSAVSRKISEDAMSVKVRSEEVWRLNWEQTPAHEIDANRPKGEVFSKLKALVWSKI